MVGKITNVEERKSKSSGNTLVWCSIGREVCWFSQAYWREFTQQYPDWRTMRFEVNDTNIWPVEEANRDAE